MTSFYELSNEDQARYLTDLARAALTRWDGEFGAPKLLKYRENAVFCVPGENGTRFALRIHRSAYHTDAQLRSELYWMTELARCGVDVPPIIPTSGGDLFARASAPGVPEIRQVDMLGWLSGAPLGSHEVGGNSDPRWKGALYHRVGELTARLHNQGTKIRLPDDFVRHRWDEAGLLGSQPLWGRFWELPALSADQRDLLLEARRRAGGELDAYGKSDRCFGMIHADLIPDNMLDDRGRLQLIDFDDCGFGWYMFELATTLGAVLDENDYPLLRDRLFAGYRTVRPLSDADIERLPLFLFLRASTYLGWLQTRAETQTARRMASRHIEQCCRLAAEYLNSRNRSERNGEHP